PEQFSPPVIGRPEIETGNIVQEVAVPGVHPIYDRRYPAVLRKYIVEPVAAMHEVAFFGAMIGQSQHTAVEAIEEVALQEGFVKHRMPLLVEVPRQLLLIDGGQVRPPAWMEGNAVPAEDAVA